MYPTKINQMDDRTLGITWSDGHASQYDVVFLRGECCCAACQDEWSGKKLILPSAISPTVRPLKMESIGHYGIQIHWSDGHSTGIYTYDSLRKICQCEICK